MYSDYPKARASRKGLLAIEFAILFLGFPLIILAFKVRLLMFIMMWAGSLTIYHLYRDIGAVSTPWRKGIRPMVKRFVLLAPMITLLSLFMLPEYFLELPTQRTLLWLAIMTLYPVLSVWPQETIYRKYIYHRYAPLFGTGRGYVVASAVAFGYAHVILMNWVAILMCTAGGAIFAYNYSKNRSLLLVCIEHALYGCLIFTVGMGRYFYTGSAWGQ